MERRPSRSAGKAWNADLRSAQLAEGQRTAQTLFTLTARVMKPSPMQRREALRATIFLVAGPARAKAAQEGREVVVSRWAVST